MQNNTDFIYEYSDLNLFHTRVKVLTGKYKDLVVEFGGSGLAQWEDKNLFNFDHTMYVKPENFNTDGYEEFLAYLLVDVIDDRNKDPKRKEKLDEAASANGMQSSVIKIPEQFYKTKATVI